MLTKWHKLFNFLRDDENEEKVCDGSGAKRWEGKLDISLSLFLSFSSSPHLNGNKMCDDICLQKSREKFYKLTKHKRKANSLGLTFLCAKRDDDVES